MDPAMEIRHWDISRLDPLAAIEATEDKPEESKDKKKPRSQVPIISVFLGL